MSSSPETFLRKRRDRSVEDRRQLTIMPTTLAAAHGLRQVTARAALQVLFRVRVIRSYMEREVAVGWGAQSGSH